MDFKEQIIEYRKTESSIPALSNKTDIYFLDKYGVDKKGGDFKYTGILIPGNIYFFAYPTNTVLSEKVKFINRNPLVLYISSERVGEEIIVKTIDLTLTPPEQRLEILQQFWGKFQSNIEYNKKKISEGGSPDEIRLTSKDLPSLFKGTGYTGSFTGFKFKFMIDIKGIDYSDWHKLPYLKYTQVQGIPVNEIYNNYRSKLNQ